MAIAGTTEQVCADAAEQAEAAAIRIAAALKDGGAMVATGGSTPGLLYDRLAAKPLPWERVQVTLSDERWVAADDPDSNERLVRRRLLHGAAAAAAFTPLKTDDPTPEAALSRVERAIAALTRPFACVLLGMGEDGHVASLFPGGAGPEALDPDGPARVVAARAPDGRPRLSLTFKALLDTRLIVLVIRGEAKGALVHDALAGRAPHLPIAALLRLAACPVEVFWAP